MARGRATARSFLAWQAVWWLAQEVFVAHANARLNLHGRRLLVSRVIDAGRPVAPVAKELGLSRQCAHRWVAVQGRRRCRPARPVVATTQLSTKNPALRHFEARTDPAHPLADPELAAQPGERIRGIGGQPLSVWKMTRCDSSSRQFGPLTASTPPRAATAILIAAHANSASGCSPVAAPSSRRLYRSITVAR